MLVFWHYFSLQLGVAVEEEKEKEKGKRFVKTRRVWLRVNLGNTCT